MPGRCDKCRENDGLYIVESERWPSSDVCTPQKIKIEFACWFCDNKYIANMEFESLNSYLDFKEKHQPYND